MNKPRENAFLKKKKFITFKNKRIVIEKKFIKTLYRPRFYMEARRGQ